MSKYQFIPSMVAAFMFVVPTNSAWASQCQTLFEPASRAISSIIPDVEQIKRVVGDEVAIYTKQTADSIIEVLSDSSLSRDGAVTRITDIIAQNLYLEPLIPKPLIAKMADDFISNPQTSETLRNHFAETLSKRRQMYFERRSKLETGNEVPLDLSRDGFSQKTFATFKMYKAHQPIKFAELKNLIPSLDRTWRREFDLRKKANVEVILFEIADIPGNFIAVFNDVVYMNMVFQRSSIYIETNQGLVTGAKVFGTVAGGHDLKGPDLMRFWRVTNDAEFQLNIPDVLNPIEYKKRMNLESEFFGRVIVPILKERGEDQVVFLAAATDTGSRRVITHEAWHGKYFTDLAWRERVQEYWNKLSSEGRNMFKEAVKEVGYDINNNDLMANEFQAYMLQEDDPVSEDMSSMLEKLRPAFFRAMGITAKYRVEHTQHSSGKAKPPLSN